MTDILREAAQHASSAHNIPPLIAVGMVVGKVDALYDAMPTFIKVIGMLAIAFGGFVSMKSDLQLVAAEQRYTTSALQVMSAKIELATAHRGRMMEKFISNREDLLSQIATIQKKDAECEIRMNMVEKTIERHLGKINQ